jgi:hypothetical protein
MGLTLIMVLTNIVSKQKFTPVATDVNGVYL